MKNRIITNTNRTIKKSVSRFVSLLIMSMLGVLVFTGLQATSPDMIKTLDNYLDKYNNYDLKIMSDMGLVDDDISALKNIKGVDEVEGAYFQDVIIKLDDGDDTVLNVSSIPKKINKIKLIKGRMPQNKNEIVVEENFITKNDLSIGDYIYIDSDVFLEKQVKIVGTVKSSLYYNNADLSQDRGTTSIGTGKINYYSYVLEDNFNQEYYNYIYLTVKNAKGLITSTDEYVKLIDDVNEKISDIKEEREDLRYRKIYNDASLEISKKESELNSKLALLQSYGNLEEYEVTKHIVEQEIANSKKTLEEINKPTWYIYDREDEKTYSDYINDANSIANLSKIFPLVFFAVAVLVSLISMNRMVLEDRGEIGTLKSLGFSNFMIMIKYFVFSLIATVVGGILGSIIGLTFLPTVIFNIYQILFDVPDLVLGLNLKSTLLGFFISVICVCGTTIFTAYKVLKEKPSELMRPKAPKSGKRVFLENIKFIWNNIKFSRKVTIRNLFRYKKRVIVTVVGVAGCTALMLCGFGIKDAIVDIASKQFDHISKFDGTVYMNKIDQNYKEIFNNDNIKSAVKSQRMDAKVDGIDSYIFVTDNSHDLSKLITLEDEKTGKLKNLESGKVIITEKLSKLTGVKSGDKINIVDVKNKKHEYEVSSVVKNYIGHYIYMDKDTFINSGEEYIPNVVYINTKKKTNQEQLSRELLKNSEVLNVQFKDSLIKSVDDMLGSLDSVVRILILLASALSFVVLYNLSNINIHERKREIATLKVLGFYDKEVDDYITKENILLTVIGISIGLVCGYFLTKAVISTVEIESCRFIFNIKLKSYIYSTLISFIFTLIVNFTTHFKLKKIDMIDSLKSVE